MFAHLERPCLRPGLAVAEDPDPGFRLLFDNLGLTPSRLRVSTLELDVLARFLGDASLVELQAALQLDWGGRLVSLDWLGRLAEKLDQALFLEGPRFRARLESPVRPPACVGCYSDDPDLLDRQLTTLFTSPGGPGLPAPEPLDDGLTAALVPHIDYGRGGVSYGWGFKEVVERSRASLFVILATSHHSRRRFILTRQDFATPIGVVPTDQSFIDRVVSHYGPGLFDDPLAHAPEHSIELEVVLLHWLLRHRRPFRIVPLLVGSFHDAVVGREAPARKSDVARMVQALREAARQTGEPVCYLISGDLAHIGPKFGDPSPVSPRQLEHSRAQDERLIAHATRADADGYFRHIQAERDGRRICGFPPTYLYLELQRPARGRLLHYGQHVGPRGHESVSFASVGFYR